MKREIGVLVIALFVISVSLAASVEVYVTPSTLWRGETATINVAGCPADSTVTITMSGANLYSPVEIARGAPDSNETYSISYTFNNQPGYYDINVICEINDTTDITNTTRINIRDLELTILDTSITASQGSSQDIRVKAVKKDGRYPEGVIVNPTFSVWIGDKSLSVQDSKVVDGANVITVKIPKDIALGTYDLKVRAEYNGSVVEKTASDIVTVTPALDIVCVSTTGSCVQGQQLKVECEYNNACEIPLYIKLNYNTGNPITSLLNKFRINIPQVTVTPQINPVVCIEDQKMCLINVSVPSGIDPGEHAITISVSDGTYSDSIAGYLDIIIPFKGQLLDASGDVVGATIEFSGPIVKSDTTDSYGRYYIGLVPGTYNLKLSMPGITGILSNVTIDKDLPAAGDRGLIWYDEFTSPPADLSGIKPAKIVVLQTGFEFDDGSFEMNYDDKVVFNESNLDVYVCYDWNYGRRTCTGGWTKISSAEIYRNINRVKFNTKGKTGAFIIGERKFLHFYAFDIEDKDYAMGESIQVKGKVLDDSGRAVQDAVVSVKIEGTNITSVTKTLSDGTFSTYIEAPMEPKAYVVTARVTKSPFIQGGEEDTIHVVEKRDLSIVVPTDTTQIILDNPFEVSVNIFNSGQTNITDLNLRLSGISSSWYSIVPQHIEQLNAKDSASIKIIFNISSESCKEKCQKYYLLTLTATGDAKGETLEKTASFTIELNPPTEKPRTSITGAFIQNIRGINIETVMGVVIGASIVVLVALGINKRLNKTNWDEYDWSINIGETGTEYEETNDISNLF